MHPGRFILTNILSSSVSQVSFAAEGSSARDRINVLERQIEMQRREIGLDATLAEPAPR